MAASTEDLLARCVVSWCAGATGIANAARLSGGASQETWSFDIVHPDGNIGAILRRAPPGYGAAPDRAAGLGAEAMLMQRAYAAGIPSPRVMHVLSPADELGTGFIMGRVDGETIPRKILRDDPSAWEPVKARLRLKDDAALAIYRQRYLEGVPKRAIAEEAEDARVLYRRLAEVGAEELVGKAKELDAALFYDPTLSE